MIETSESSKGFEPEEEVKDYRSVKFSVESDSGHSIRLCDHMHDGFYAIQCRNAYMCQNIIIMPTISKILLKNHLPMLNKFDR